MPPQGYWALQAQQPNLIQIFQASGLARQDRDRREQQNLQNKMAQEQAQAVQQRFDRSQQAAGRQLAQRATEHRADQEAIQAQRMAQKQRFYSKAIQARPEQAGQIRVIAQSQGVEIPEIAAQDPSFVGPPTPYEISGQMSPEQASTALSAQAAGVLGPEAASGGGAGALDAVAKRAQFEFNLAPTQRPTSDQYRAVAEQMQREQVAARRAGAVTVNTGDLSKKTKQDLETEIIKAGETLRTFADIRKTATKIGPDGQPVTDYSPFLSLGGKMRQRIAKGLDLLDIDPKYSGLSKKQYRAALEFKALVDGYRAAKFKELLGSAQSEQEIRNLVDAIASTDMPPQQFGATMDNLERLTRRSIDVAKRLLAKGLDPQSREFAIQHDRAMGKGGRQQGQRKRRPVPAAAKTRMQQLFDRFVDVDGMSEADAIAKARQVIAQERGQ